MKAEGKGLELNLELNEMELNAVEKSPLRCMMKFISPYPKPEETQREINFILAYFDNQREYVIHKINPEGYVGNAEGIGISINKKYLKELKRNKDFEVNYSAGLGKLKISITD
jgi:hypothetical protein